MSDLVKRLRARKAGTSDDSIRMVWEMSEAADCIEALEAEVARLQTAGIHTCHDQCQRYACVQFRRAEAAEAKAARMEEALKHIAYRGDGAGENRPSFVQIARKALEGAP